MILLLNPPSHPLLVANREGTAGFGALSQGFAYPPHTLAILLAGLRQRHPAPPAQVIDAVAAGLDLVELCGRIAALAPTHLAIFCSWATLAEDSAALTALAAAFPQLPRIAFGAGVRYHAEPLLAAGATHVLLGDPELALPALLAGPLPPPGPLSAHDLLPAEHNRNGLLRHPDALPRPAWEETSWRSYGFLTLFGARGCDDHCKFCAYVVAQGRAYRARPAAAAAAEMIWLAETFAPPRIMVRDPVFAADRVRAMAFARALSAAHFRTPWECESRPEHFDPALLKEMARAGCTVIKLGIESADPGQLAALGRVDGPEEAAIYLAYARQVVAVARRVGIATRAYVLVGLPGQTVAETTATAAFLRQMQPTFVHPRPYVAYPRVPLGPGVEPAEMALRPADHSSQWAELAAPLQAVAEERLAAARRRQTLPGRWQQRARRLLLRWGV